MQLSLRRGTRRGTAVLVIEVAERNTLIVQNLWIGIAADEDTAGNSKPLSAFAGIRAAETNLLGTGIALGAGIGFAADQLALRAHVEDPAFAGTSWSGLLSVLYANTVRPFDAVGLRSVLQRPDVVLVEPYLAGTSTRLVNDSLSDLPHRVVSLGVGDPELRRYGSPADHMAAHGLDAAGLRVSISGFLAEAADAA